jgi:hypothetical protein
MGSLKAPGAHWHPGLTAPRTRVVDPVKDADPETVFTDGIAWLTQLMTDVAQSLNGVALQGALPVPFGWDKDGRGPRLKISSSAGRLLGYSLYETAGHDVVVNFYDNDLGTTDGADVWHADATANTVTNLLDIRASFSIGLSVEFVTTGGQVRGIALLGGVD